MTIRTYTPSDSHLWNLLAAESRQGTFLHRREYMDYHADRFRDCSLIAERYGVPVALLPANLTDDGTLHSHRGLTYGGWLTPRFHFDGTDMLRIFDAWMDWCREHEINQIVYKAVPHIYHRIPAEEDLYALFRFGAAIGATNLSSVIDMREIPAFNTQQKRNLKKANAENLSIRETQDASEFMPLLIDCLRDRHNTAPVHSESELKLLKERFPEEIRFFLAGKGSEAEAAVCIYDANSVAHCQYIASSEAGRQSGALACLFNHLIHNVFAGNRYFDFGTSNEESGLILNSSLLHQKVGLGGRGTVYSIYKIQL